jgi:hypothetical protein
MKQLFSALIITLFVVTSCNTSSKEPVKSTEVKADSIKKEITPKDTIKVQAYVCPMGPQCGQGDKPGKCPSCGMELKENPAFKKNN